MIAISSTPRFASLDQTPSKGPPDVFAPVLRQDRERLELRESPGAPASVSGAYCDEGIADRTVRSFREQEEGLII